MTPNTSAVNFSSNPTVLDRRMASTALMFIATHGTDLSLATSWTKVDTAPNLPKIQNVSPVIFDYGVTITQRLKKYRCILELSPYQYTDSVVSQGQKETGPTTIIFKCTGDYQLVFWGDEKAGKQLPLAKLCYDKLHFDYIKLSIQPSKFMLSAGLETEETEGRNAHLRTLGCGLGSTICPSENADHQILLHQSFADVVWKHVFPEDPTSFAALDEPTQRGNMTPMTLERELLQIQKLKEDTIQSLEMENEEFLRAQEQKLQKLRIKLQQQVQEAVAHIENAEARVKFETQSLKNGEASEVNMLF